jgi:hypothetical protein
MIAPEYQSDSRQFFKVIFQRIGIPPQGSAGGLSEIVGFGADLLAPGDQSALTYRVHSGG